MRAQLKTLLHWKKTGTMEAKKYRVQHFDPLQLDVDRNKSCIKMFSKQLSLRMKNGSKGINIS